MVALENERWDYTDDFLLGDLLEETYWLDNWETLRALPELQQFRQQLDESGTTDVEAYFQHSFSGIKQNFWGYIESVGDPIAFIRNNFYFFDRQKTGGDNTDYLYGGKGNDSLTGNAGDDILDGGWGQNHLQGGAGNDQYIMNTQGAFPALETSPYSNIINDSDSQGSIVINGNVLSGEAESLGDGRWRLSDSDAGAYEIHATDQGAKFYKLVNNGVLDVNNSFTIQGLGAGETALGIALQEEETSTSFTFKTTISNAEALGQAAITPLTITYDINFDSISGTEIPDSLNNKRYGSINATVTIGDWTFALTGGTITITDDSQDGYYVQFYNDFGETSPEGYRGFKRIAVEFVINNAQNPSDLVNSTALPSNSDFVANADSGGAVVVLFDDSAGYPNYIFLTTPFDQFNSFSFENGSSSTPTDTTEGTSSADALSATAGVSSFINGLGGNDTLNGNDGNDSLYGGAGEDELNGADGDDIVVGGAGHDLLNGDTGNDTLYGENGDDTVNAGSGDDVIIGGSGRGDDVYDGGDGIDSIIYTSTTQGIIVDLSAGTASGTEIDNDTLLNIEKVQGGTGNDTIAGDAGANLFIGEAGNDSFNGLDGNDTLEGNSGNDVLEGGADNGLMTFIGDPVIQTFHSITYTGNTEAINVSDVDEQGDVISATARSLTANQLTFLGRLSDGDAIYRVNNGGESAVNWILNNTTNDGIDFPLSIAANSAVIVNVGNIANSIAFNVQGSGAPGSTATTGSTALSLQQSGGGITAIDQLIYGDIITGGEGADIFLYTSPAHGVDTISDFTVGADKLRLTETLKHSAEIISFGSSSDTTIVFRDTMGGYVQNAGIILSGITVNDLGLLLD